MSWSTVALRRLYRRRDVTGRAELPLLSVYRDLGVVPREGRDDNNNRPGEDLSTYRLVRPGDLVINKMKTWQGSLGVSDHLGIVSPAYFVATPHSSQIHGPFMHHLLRSRPLIAEYARRSKGIRPAQWDLPWEEFGDIRVPLPPLGTQRAIADFLDRETARIDALTAAKRRMIKLIDERKWLEQAQLAVRGKRSAAMRKVEPQWVGEMPRHWELRRLKFDARLESGHTPSRTRPELWENCDTPWVTLNDVGAMAEHEFLEETMNLISPEGLANSSARVLPVGTVVLSRDATIGRCAILARPMATSQHFADWICGPRLRPRYLWLLFRGAMQPRFDSLTDGATLRTIGMPSVKEFILPVPPLEEQDEIVAAAERKRKLADASTVALRLQIELLVEHRQALITAAVTGELDVGVAA